MPLAGIAGVWVLALGLARTYINCCAADIVNGAACA